MDDTTMEPEIVPVCSNGDCEEPADRLVRALAATKRSRTGELDVLPVADSLMCAEHAELFVRVASIVFSDGPTVYVHRLDDGAPVTYFAWAPGGQGVRWDAA